MIYLPEGLLFMLGFAGVFTFAGFRFSESFPISDFTLRRESLGSAVWLEDFGINVGQMRTP